MKEEDKDQTTSKMEESKEESKIVVEEKIKPKLIPLELMKIAQEAQAKICLKTKDYERYHHYCSKKINLLRKQFKLTKDKKKKAFEQKIITADIVMDSKMLLIPLFQAERYWAYAMFLKQRNTQSFMDTSRSIFQIKKLLKKAAREAERLYIESGKIMDPQTIFEAKAISRYYKGIYQIEKNKFDESISSLTYSLLAYEKEKCQKDDLTGLLYDEKAKSIEVFVRLSLSKQNQDLSGPEFLKVKSILSEEIEEDIKNVRKITATKDPFSEIKYKGNTIPLNTEELILFNKNSIILLENLNNAQNDAEKKELLIKLFSLLSDWEIKVRKQKTEEAKKAEGSVQIFNILLQYISILKSQKMIEKQILNLNEFRVKLEKEGVIEKILMPKVKNKKGSDILLKIVKILGNILKKLRQIHNYEKDSNSPDLVSELELSDKICRAELLFYKELFFLSIWKFEESYFIGNKAYEISMNCKDSFQEKGKTILPYFRYFQEMISEDLKLMKRILLSTHALGLLWRVEKTKKPEGNSEKRDTFKIHSLAETLNPLSNHFYNYNLEKIEMELADSNSITENMNTELLMAREEGIKIKKSLKNAKIINFIPELELLHVKPNIFDIAFSRIEIPDIKGFIDSERQKGKSFLSKTFGKLFGK